MQLTQTIIRFPEIQLQTRDAHKLRGYFGKLFNEHSPLLHNHFKDGSIKYAYPLVQYKVIDKVPCLVGFSEGGSLLTNLFLKIKEIEIAGKSFQVNSKNISQKNIGLSINQQLYNYRFKTLWMGLNQKNYKAYIQLDGKEKKEFLNKMLQNNILSFYKGVGLWVNEKIMATGTLAEKQTLFKNQAMLAFSGIFTSNAFIPDFTGIGKSVSRGFGTVEMIK